MRFEIGDYVKYKERGEWRIGKIINIGSPFPAGNVMVSVEDIGTKRRGLCVIEDLKGFKTRLLNLVMD